MKLVVLDLEMNQPSNSIIQIGVVLLDCRTGQITDMKHWYVQLLGEELDPEISELCNIYPAELLAETGAILLGHALEKFWEYVGNKPVASWGGDHHMVQAASDAIGIGYKTPRVLDLKTLGMVMRATRGPRARGGLKNTMELFGVPFEGRQHQAPVDAFNTARLLWQWLRTNMAADEMMAAMKAPL